MPGRLCFSLLDAELFSKVTRVTLANVSPEEGAVRPGRSWPRPRARVPPSEESGAQRGLGPPGVWPLRLVLLMGDASWLPVFLSPIQGATPVPAGDGASRFSSPPSPATGGSAGRAVPRGRSPALLTLCLHRDVGTSKVTAIDSLCSAPPRGLGAKHPSSRFCGPGRSQPRQRGMKSAFLGERVNTCPMLGAREGGVEMLTNNKTKQKTKSASVLENASITCHLGPTQSLHCVPGRF